MTPSTPARNLLSDQSSPYLLQHADNPVHWRPWGKAALREANETGKPILLSVGYAACHWCHVMAHESFEDDEIADLMNRLFVNIKVDREERPDVDQLYMAALHAMGQQGGWPLTMFLQSDGRPFWGGTYFPPEDRYGRPGFPSVLKAVHKAWLTDHETMHHNAEALTRHIEGLYQPPKEISPPPANFFQKQTDASIRLNDAVNGGVGTAPKFPNAPITQGWLRRAGGDPAVPTAQAFLHTIERISNGGIYDHIGGGLSRYSVDEKWLVPHFEKMLYDNAHFVRCLTWAHQLDPQPLFRQRIEETFDWLVREMQLPGGAFASSLDADSEGIEGKYYVWSRDELAAILGDKADCFASHYDITDMGNFEGANIPNRLGPTIPTADEDERLAHCRQIILKVRQTRIPPGKDDKVLADWNGYMIRALAEAGFAFSHQPWIDIARQVFRFITESMSNGDELCHSWRNGIVVRPALASDYAAMTNAAISLHLASPNTELIQKSRDWLATLDRDYPDGSGGYFLTAQKADDLITRPRGDQDEANPSASSQILEAKTRLSRITGDTDLLDSAHRLAANIHSATAGGQYGNAGFANALHTLREGRHVTLFVDEADESDWTAILRRQANPSLTWETIRSGSEPNHFSLTPGQQVQRPAAIICTDTACSAPLESVGEFEQALAQP